MTNVTTTFSHSIYRVCILAILTWSVITSAANSQTPDQQWESDISTWPKDISLEPVTSTLGSFVVGRVLNAGNNGICAPTPNARPLGNTQAAFMEEFLIVKLGEQSHSLNGYCLLARNNFNAPKNAGKYKIQISDLFGWVPEELVLQRNEPLTVTQETQLYRKARYIFSLEEIQALKKNLGQVEGNELKWQSTVYQRIVGNQDLNFNRVDRTRAAFFVYGEIWVNQGRLVKANQGDKYLLLGTADRLIATNRKPSEIILGWVKASTLSEWSTRIAVEWNSDTAPLRPRKGVVLSVNKMDPQGIYAFDESESIKLALQFSLSDGDDKIGEARVPGVNFSMKEGDQAFADDDWRMPVLERIDFSLIPDKFPNVWNEISPENRGKLKEQMLTGNTLYRVGWEGKSGGNQESRKEADKQLNEVTQKITHWEILFLIDRTESMKSVYSAVAAAIANALNKLVQLGVVESLKVSICFFGSDKQDLDSQELQILFPKTGLTKVQQDYLSEIAKSTDKYATVRRLNTNDPQSQDPIRRLMNRVFTTTIPGDNVLHEQVADGIVRSIARAGFTKTSSESTQMVILLGDAGDVLYHDSENLSPKNRRDRMIVVKDTIWPKDCKDRIFCGLRYATKSPTALNAPAAYNDFKIMVEDIAGYGKSLNNYRTDIAKFADAIGEQAVEDLIIQQLDLLSKRTRQLRDEIEALQQGRSHTISKELTDLLLTNNQEKVTDDNAKALQSKLLKALNSEFIYVEAFVWDHDFQSKKNRLPVLRQRVLLNEIEIKEILDQLEKFTSYTTDEPINLLDVFRPIVKNISDESLSTKTIDQLWKQRYDLSLNSRLFKEPLNKLINIPETYAKLEKMRNAQPNALTEEEERERKELQKALMDLWEFRARLEDVTNKVSYKSYTVNMDTFNRFTVERGERLENHNRWFSIPGTTGQWLWLLLDDGMLK